MGKKLFLLLFIAVCLGGVLFFTFQYFKSEEERLRLNSIQLKQEVEEQEENSKVDKNNNNNNTNNKDNEDAKKLFLKINNQILTVALVNNTATKELLEKLENGSITIEMSDYAKMEKVGTFDFNLTTNDEQIDTNFGDVVLQQGNSFVVFYDKNTWNYTKLGTIENTTQEELKTILGSENVIVTLSKNKEL